ncbi:hypothetical protein GT755_30510 [Herbidospora sp. NEAU-GS84]|uniref:Uncharacterized protein n=1 Tax=Herbidospora solisilvae TaxID=2696284 RepID=A0A7C9NL49_9ACTN|nr:hypothetical protein [Herbidospora solisilvae]NAS25998.1 hypothetical protein [Herbidospora solisilvae]
MRVVRLYRPDRNPLRRSSDRWEAAVVAVLVSLALLSLWPAVWIASAMYESGVRAEAAAPPGRALVVIRYTTGRWRSPDGAVVAGKGLAPPASQADTIRQVWLDGRHQIAPRPRDPQELALAAGITGLGTALTAAGLLAVVYMWVRFFLNRRRLTRWGDDWLVADRRWRRPRQA